MRDAFRLFMQHQRTQGHAPSTLEWHEERLGRFLAFLEDRGHPTSLGAIRAPHLRDFIAHLQTECARPGGLPLSPSYIHGHARSIKAFFNWCYREELLERNPMDKVQRPKLPQEAKPTYTPQDVERLLDACDRRTITGARDFAAILLLYSSGLRAEELLGLREQDLDPKHDLLMVRRGKGSKFRPVPYQGAARKAVEAYLGHPRRVWALPDPEGHIFLTDDGRPITYQGLHAALKRLGRRVGVEGGLHKFRHSMAVEYLRAGGRLETLKNTLGHTDYNLTLHYGRQAGVDIAKEHRNTDPASRLRVRV